MEEKKKLNLKIKTFADLRRFKSRQLHKIVEKFREQNKGKSIWELEKEGKYFEIIKYAAKQSLIKRADRSKIKQKQKIRDDAKSKRDILNELKENGKINDKQYSKAMEDLTYRTSKKIYVNDLGPKNQEKPKNPKIQRAIDTVGKVAKTVGKGLTTGATVVAGVVAAPFVGAYKLIQTLGRGIKTLGRGGKNLALTAGKVTYKGANAVAKKVEPGINAVKDTAKAAGQTIKETSQEVKETEDARRDSKNAKTFEERMEIFENSSKNAQEAIISDDYKAALKENAKRDREAARRENLHMDSKQQTIDHEQAKKNVFERVDAQELTPEEVKEVYGEEK